MTNTTVFSFLSISALALMACGGGSSTNNGGYTQNPPQDAPPSGGSQQTSNVPASTSNEDLIAFAAGGTSRPVGGTTIDGEVTRQQRNFTDENGVRGTVAVDRLNGTDFGLIQYRLGNDIWIYRIDGEPVASHTLPGGRYVGNWDINYKFDHDTPWDIASGDFGMTLNIADGTVAIGGMAANARHSVEIFADANVVNNAFGADDVTYLSYILRDQSVGGVFVRRERDEGDFAVSGSGFVNDNGDAAFFGNTSANNPATGFEMEGGFAAPLIIPD
ncbi:hypothetical protein [Roseinatronobacter bogoriensis]|uniref:hypothetical protein n=1 Tax=Roseinatronobacter bogoriensis TaxID=119542 RepID=UPI0008F84A4B|nr:MULTISPECIES: hypothetical protein [Rhodobaca]MBB4209324.1 hypothetical protein [Rhodobaca bogoriensis DSM 18756]TDW34342.1 hypothetical protein LY39_03397 [Rhodobaca barguzinensis]TDY67067.1 hypothetical protein EV660_10868 [Rhodobaca bogoriensis DSM 18756]